MRRRRIISMGATDRIIRKAGIGIGNIRVSENAASLLAEELEKLGIYIGKWAIELAINAKRTTVKSTDISLALRQMRRNVYHKKIFERTKSPVKPIQLKEIMETPSLLEGL